MPMLEWIGKRVVVNHHHDVPFRLLKEETKLAVGGAGDGNLLVEVSNQRGLAVQ